VTQSIEHMVPSAAPARVGQGTAVEQSRAVAEVQAAIVVAQQCPRNITAAIAEMQQVCRRKALAERAFYSFPRSDGTVSGPTVQLARELARCWGNVQYGLIEMRRDDEYGESEMQAFAWDVQTNARVSSTFIVPHRRDTRNGTKKLTDMRDIYESNANNGARRVREQIFAVLPGWFVDEAVDTCRNTLKDGGGVPLPQRVAKAVQVFEGIGVHIDRIETKLGRPSSRWTEHDVTELQILFRSIDRREVLIDEAFPQPRVTADEVVQSHAARPAQPAPAGRADDRGLPHEWTLADVARALGMSDQALEERCYGVTGGPLGDASDAQIRALTQELANELVAQRTTAGGTA
jgi:AraC-like DNA-binding protein